MRRIVFLGALALAMLPAGAQSDLPEGRGKELVLRECTKCHGLEGITRARMTKDRWDEVVDDMVSRGAGGTEEEIDQMIAYLAVNFGKVNINKASAGEIASALGISADTASAVVTYREKNGQFKSANDLKKVPGLDAKRIDELKERIEY
jgi:competence protein ComEA